ncbi:MAG: DNA adenine methylase, partial [Candidatus Methanomethylicaceae archaeon]
MHQLDLDIIDNCEPGRIRAPFSWYGGKKLLASWIISYLTPCKIYVEPFAGAANVFWHLPTGFYQMAVLNDIDERVVRVYRALQDPDKFEKLAHMLIWTPYSRAEYRRALEILSANDADDVEAAWALIVASVQGYSGWFKTDGNWSRSFSCDKPGAWHRRAGLLPVWREKLARAYIDNVDAMACIKYWDSADTLFYVDPPYVVDVRAEKYGYRYELDLAGHARLVQ